MVARTVIKLTGENHKDIDDVAAQIKTICDSGGINLRGPILSQPADSSCLFAKHPTAKEAKPTTTGKCASTSVCLRWTSPRPRTKPLFARSPRFPSLTPSALRSR